MSTRNFKILSNSPAATVISPSMLDRRIDADCFHPIYLRNENILLNGSIRSERLGSLFSKGNYGSLPDSVDYATSGTALIRGTDLQLMSVNLNDAIRVPDSYYDQFKKARIQPGDILLLVKGASIDRPDSIAMYPQTDEKAIANGSIFIIRTNPQKINNHYLLAVMTSESFLLQKRRGSSNTGALYNDLDTIKKFIVPLPDPKIQEYIGSKVELAERCRSKAKDFKTSMKLKISTFLEAPNNIELNKLAYWIDDFLTPARLDSMYYQPTFIENKTYLSTRDDIFKLNDDKCCELVTDGDHGNLVYSENGPKYLRVTDFHGFNLQYKNMSSINPVYADKIGSRCIVKKGDVIVSIVGTIGLITVINRQSEGAIASRGVARLVPSKSLNPYYLASYLSSIRGQLQLKQLCVGTVQKGIYLESLNQLLVPIPPKKIQDDIGNALKRYIWLIDYLFSLSEDAKSDVEALIEGTLDTDAILSGRMKVPVWEDVEKELEEVQS